MGREEIRRGGEGGEARRGMRNERYKFSQYWSTPLSLLSANRSSEVLNMNINKN